MKITTISAIIIASIFLALFQYGQIDANSVGNEEVVNVYSSRKEGLVKGLFDRFTEQTGIKVNFVKDKAAKLIVRLQSEKENTPADLLLTSDVGNLEYAKDLGLFLPIKSDVLEDNVPEKYRDPENNWFGLSLRARAIFYSKDRVKKSDLSTYEDLANDKWKGRVLIRSSSNIYNQSLLASIIESSGIESAKEWASGLVTNFARKPQGGDTDQIKAVASGEGDVAIANTYYYGRLLSSEKNKDREIASKVGVFFPNQDDRGTHVNVSGGGVLRYAKNKDNALKLLEFLSGEEAQRIYAEVNHEYPVSSNVLSSEIVKQWGEFKKDKLPIASFIKFRSKILKITDKVGWR